jgi:DNA-binding NtrC family response regulator
MTATSKTSILILDDEPIVSKRLQPALEKKGYEVESFYESAKAMVRIRERTFDIVVTDLKMEGIDGMQFLAEVKKLSPRTEVIVITGFATMDGEIQEVIRKAEEHIRLGKEGKE